MKAKYITVAIIAALAVTTVGGWTCAAQNRAEIETLRADLKETAAALVTAENKNADLSAEITAPINDTTIEENYAEIGDFGRETASVYADMTQEYIGTYKITHYCPCEKCCGPYANGYTASGAPCVEGVTIACDNLPIGTVVNIGGHLYTVQDRFGSFDGRNLIDIYVDDHDRANALGTYETDVYEVIFTEVE